MTSLHEIPGLDPNLVPLLENAGIESPGDLVDVPSSVVHRALEKALGTGEAVPSLQDVENWQGMVRGDIIPGGDQSNRVPLGESLPVAKALSSRQLMDSGIPASSVPEARILGEPTAANLRERPSGEVAPPKPAIPWASAKSAIPQPTTSNRGSAEPVLEKRPLAVRSVEPKITKKEPEPEAPEPMKFNSTDGRSREEEDFERKNKGMSHKSPGLVYRGALATLLTNLLTLIGVGSIGAALWLEFVAKTEAPTELAWGLLAFPAALLIFLLLATQARCRLCGQRLYVPRGCRKHVKAHRSILGYATSLALHVVVFRWFRCSLCGTKQRLKQ